MAAETEQEGCKVQGQRTPDHVPGATQRPKSRPQRGEVQHGIADADKKVRTGSQDESVRDTPPSGDWNDIP